MNVTNADINGSEYRTPQDTCVYAIGDIHGRRDLLVEIYAKIREDSRTHPASRRIVVHLGDYVDRGADTAGVIDLFIDFPLDGFEPVWLKGNHEDFMLDFLDGKNRATSWLMNGAASTFESYGIDCDPYFVDEEEIAALRRQLTDAMPDRHLAFLRSDLRHYHPEGDYLFVHAGIRPGLPLVDQDPQDLMWIREHFLAHEDGFGWRVVYGHTPGPAPVVTPGRIGIDTGAWYSDILTCAVIEGASVRFLQTG